MRETNKGNVNWLVIGIGDITRKRVIPAILAERRSTLCGIVTRDLTKAADYREAKAWNNLAAALRDPAIDAVYVASPVALHHQHTVASLTAGKDVLCEKPVGMNYGEALSMAEVSEAAGKLLGVAFFRRFFPKLLRTKQLILDGAIGHPVLAESSFHGWLESEERAWLRDPALAGGGPLYDTASHRIDAFNYLFGTPEFATGIRSNPIHNFAVDEAATVTILYPEGVHGIIDVRWNSRLLRDECRIIGTDGEISLTPFAGPTLRVITRQGTVEENLPANPNVHYPLIENFTAAMLDGTPLAAPIREAIKTDWVTEQVLNASPEL
jgi:1,5-anhydro-D-fructose reductase (1,5-anhydro-D-mannitol-forming)